MTTKNRILAAMEDEARYVVRTVTIDLDAFLALKGEARAARWRQWDEAAKFQAVALMLERKEGDWTVDGVAFWTNYYNEKYAAGPIDAAVEGALERLALDNSAHAETAENKTDRAYFRRAATSYTNALIEYRAGVRPQLLASGAYVLPSRRPGEAPHLVTMNGDWTCSCKAGASMHWPLALIIGLEVAQDDMQAFDDPPCEPCPLGDEEGDSIPEARSLGARIAAARRNYAYAA